MSARVHELRLDKSKRLCEQSPNKGHNRWHPAIVPALRESPGDEALIATLNAIDGQITSRGTVADASTWDLNRARPLSGPIWIEGAEPGDLLEVKLVDIVAGESGWTAKLPGSGFLRDLFPEPCLVRWSLNGGFAEFADLPQVSIAEAAFPGVMGVAPSLAQLSSE
jgi:formamidase